MSFASWFRFYADVPDDPKIARLSDAQYRMWTHLLCIAKRHPEGKIPDDFVTLQHTLRKPVARIRDTIEVLQTAELLDPCDGGWKPHNWDKRQFKSDGTDNTNAERQRRHREKSNATRNGSETVTENVTAKRPETETETETEKQKPTQALADDLPELPDWLPKPEWAGFVEMRKRNKAPLTDRAITLAIGELEKLRAQGEDIAAVIDQSTLKGWKSFFPRTNGASGKHYEPEPYRILSLTETPDVIKH